VLVTHKIGDHVVHREVDSLALRVHLQVVGRGEQVGNTQPVVQTLHDLTHELSASDTDTQSHRYATAVMTLSAHGRRKKDNDGCRVKSSQVKFIEYTLAAKS